MLKATIPFCDLRGKTLIDLLRAYPDKAHGMLKASRRTYGWLSQSACKMLLPFSDRQSRRWLEETQNPYLHEIESFADIIEKHGIYSLNLCYEWGCTAGVWRTDESVTLLRVLDWPFPDLGRHVVIALQEAAAGEYYNITWPGFAGMVNGMSPGRFSAALNLAPMRRHRRTLAGDWLINRRIAARERGIPPSHLLRQVFETAKNYQEARQMLVRSPIAVPAIFVLAGTQAGEACVIERLEHTAETIDIAADLSVYAANHFTGYFDAIRPGWRAREIDSAGRYRCAGSVSVTELGYSHFDWLPAPIVNQRTRLAFIANAATHRLMVQGFEGRITTTEPFILPAVAYRQEQHITYA